MMLNTYLLVLFFNVLVLVVAQIPTFPDCKSGPLSSFPICNQSVPIGDRAADLISRMTTSEKISQLVRDAAAIPRLNLSAFVWASEGLHGIASSDGVHFGGDLPAATSFPMPINLGASFDVPLMHRVGSVISTEGRAFSNEGRSSLAFFTPNINIFRDPRWGRGQETPGEDPYLTSEYVYAYVTGLQNGDDERYLKSAADCKHFDAYDLEIWNGTDKHRFNAKVSDQDLVETYLPPFETCIRDARVASIMCSYNMINGIPACANRFFLQTIARDTYGFDGFVISDCGAVQCIMTVQNYTKTVEETVGVAMHAGVDLECGEYYIKYAQAALDNKTIVESDIDQALIRGYQILLRLGYFDPPEQQPYRLLNATNVNTNHSQQLALQSAQESIVLLKNLNKSLPLNIQQLKNKKIALIGPTANATVLMQGDYFGKAPYLISPLMAFQTIVTGQSIDIEYAPGCEISGTNESGFATAIELARQSDIVFFFGGLNQSIEAESRDRVSIDILPIQMSLLENLVKVVRSPIHTVFMSGSSLDLSYIRDSNNFVSLIWMGYAGQSGGEALASVLFGQYNPGGRLPITFYPREYVDQVSMFDMKLRPSKTNPGRTYKFYRGEPVYPFGSGLSYTTFSYSSNNDSSLLSYSIETLLKKKNSFQRHLLIEHYRVNVTNTGSMAGDDVVLAFIIPPRISLKDPSPPLKQLFGFQRIHLNINQTMEIYFPLYLQNIQTIDSDGSKWIEPGIHQIIIGQQLIYQIQLNGTSISLSNLI